MKKQKPQTQPDPPALIALRRAAKLALQEARQTGTACYVWEGGKIVDIAAQPDAKSNTRRRRKPAKKRAKSRRGSSHPSPKR